MDLEVVLMISRFVSLEWRARHLERQVERRTLERVELTRAKVWWRK
jgi:hypothetical protein